MRVTSRASRGCDGTFERLPFFQLIPVRSRGSSAPSFLTEALSQRFHIPATRGPCGTLFDSSNIRRTDIFFSVLGGFRGSASQRRCTAHRSNDLDALPQALLSLHRPRTTECATALSRGALRRVCVQREPLA